MSYPLPMFIRTNEVPQFLESECLASLTSLPPSTNEWCSVRTPHLHHFNPLTNTQIQEYLPQAIDLKHYALKHYSPNTPSSKKEQCIAIGKSLGHWLESFHEWVSRPEQSKLREDAERNVALQGLKHASYFGVLDGYVEQYPGTLGGEEVRRVLAEVKEMADEEMEREGLQVVHGDFWTGKYVSFFSSFLFLFFFLYLGFLVMLTLM